MRRRLGTEAAGGMANRIPLLLALALAACAGGCGATIGQLPLVGEPANVPPPPEVAPAYPAVGMRPERSLKAMTAQERAKLEADLMAARTRAAQEKREQINRASGQGY